MAYKIWLSPPHVCGNELKYIHRAFHSNWIAPIGAELDTFEDEIEKIIGQGKKVIALNSGTAAIHLALILAGVSKGDEVICQSFTFVAAVNPILYLGATPIFVDSESETWNMSPILLEETIKKRLSNGKKPKAIIVVDLYGMPAKMMELTAIAERYKIPIIEDAAEAIGSRIDNRYCGTFGDFGIFSFNGNKIVTTSGGGALVCSTMALKKKAIYLATQAKDNTPHFEHSQPGYNYRLSNILAGIGVGQLKVLEERIKARCNNFNFYKTQLEKAGFQFLKEPKGFFSNRWLTCLITESFEQREKIRMALLDAQIESRPLQKPMHLQPIFEDYPKYVNGVSDSLFERGICLPSGSNLTLQDLNMIIAVIKHAIFK